MDFTTQGEQKLNRDCALCKL